MKKRCLLPFVLILIGRAWAADSAVWSSSAPSAVLKEADGFTSVSVADERFLPPVDAVGSPALPQQVVSFAVPDRASVTGVTFEVGWAPLAEGVRIVPVAEPVRIGETAPPPEPNAAIYGGTSVWPEEPVCVGREEAMCGVRVLPVVVTPFRWHPDSGLLERAERIEVRVAFADGAARSHVFARGLLESVRASVVNPADVTLATTSAPSGLLRSSRTVASTSEVKADYLLLSPPDFVSDWQWYVGERKKTHPDVSFLVKNTAEIYAEYPFPSESIRNAAESIHAYLRAKRTTIGFTYVVLGGAWLDAQNRLSVTPCFYGGEQMSLSNCVPGVYGYPREDWREIPSDMFYSCLDLIGGQRYPWDANENGVYIDQGDCSRNDLKPDVCVTRLTLNPYNPSRAAYNRHALVTNYVAKLARGEAKGFPGHFRYGLSPDSTGSRRLRANADRMCYDELEFYDDMYNMFDPRHSKWIEDNEVEPRRRIKDQFAMWRPVLETRGMMNFTWTKGQPTLSAATDHYYAGNRDYGFVYSHGWAQGATHFQASRFASCSGLTVLNGSNGPCDTGYPDFYVTMNGVPTLQYNLGDSGVTNPNGGALASINNTRWGWAGGSATGRPFDSSMSYFMLNRSLEGFNNLYLDVGHAWFKGVSDYASFGYTQGGGTHTWTLTEQICYGDPLVRLPAPEDRTWAGGPDGVWDMASVSWTDASGNACAWYSASNVWFAANGDSAISVADPVGMLRLSVTNEPNGVFSLVGTDDGSLRVMRSLTLSGGDLRLDVAGGVGHEGISLIRTDGMDRAGELTLAGTNRFYVAKVSGGSRINLLGGGVTLDADNFPSPSVPLVFDGTAAGPLPVPNELRSRNAAGLRRFGSLAMTNTWVRLATADGFGRTEPPLTHTLVGSTLEIAANAFYEWKGTWQQNGYAEKLNATFEVAGESSVTSSEGGLWSVASTTAFNLADGARLRLSAETKDCGGRIAINGCATTEVVTASSLAGVVEVGSGMTLVLDALPLASVTSLTIGDGASVVLPDAKSGYWQILPVSSKLTCGADVKFFAAGDLSNPLPGTPSQTGAFFRDGALYAWPEADMHWSASVAHRHPKILFGDFAEPTATVRVDLAVAPFFVSFANARTAYRFISAAEDAKVTFSSVLFNGDTTFELPVAATEYVEVMGGVASFSRLIAPTLRVCSGASLVLSGSHWTRIVLDEGARLVARPGLSLDWNRETEIAFPEMASVEIDVSSLTLTDEPQPLIAGLGHVWTLADLPKVSLVGQSAELRIKDGALCAVRGDGLKGPYACAFEGSASWDAAAWTAQDKPFGRTWSQCALDWSSDVCLSVSADEPTSVILDCAVKANTLEVGATSNLLSLVATDSGSLDVATCDFGSCFGGVDVFLPTGAATILCPSNETAVCSLHCAGSGTIRIPSCVLALHAVGGWTLSAGAQGTVRLVAPPGWRKFRVARVTDGFEMGGLTFEVVDRDGVKLDGFVFTHENGAVWCTPSGVKAEVSVGTNEWSDLVWTDMFGNDASDVDWRTVSGFLLVGEVGSVVTATNGFAGVLDRLSAKGPVRIAGNLTWTPSRTPKAGDLLLGGGFKVKVNLKTTPTLLNYARLGFADDATLEVSHGGAQANVSGQDWSGLFGTGAFLHLNASAANWLAWPAKGPQGDFSFHNAADVVLTENVSRETPLAVRNLSGTAGFRSDWGNGSMQRPVRTVQTKVTAFSGVFANKHNGRDSMLIVASDAPSASVEKALVLSGNNTAWHYLEVETNGCVILTGKWTGRIDVNGGLLVVTNAAALNGVTVNVVQPGRTLVTNEIPASASVSLDDPPSAPTQAPERDTPDDPVVDEPVREVVAQVASEDLSWHGLAWKDTNGVDVAVADWSTVTRATVVGVSGTRLLMDEPSFSGVAVLRGGLSLEVRGLPSFALGRDSACRVEARLRSVPSATTTLLRTEDGFSPDGRVDVTFCDRFGDVFLAPASVAYEQGRYLVFVQNLDAPAYRHTFDGSVVNPTYNATDLAETSDPKYFVPSRDGQAIVNYYYGSKNGWNLMSPFPTSWTVSMVAKMPTNKGGTLFGFGYGGYCDKGFCFSSDGTDRVALCIWRGWTVSQKLVAEVPFSTSQFHVYTATYDGAEIRFYVDGKLVRSLADTEGFTASNGGCYQFWGLCSGKYPNGLGGANGGAVDDWSFYRFCATPESVKCLAASFPPWPDTVTATAWEPETRWSDLIWEPETEDWSSVSFARIAVGADGASVVYDEPSFVGTLDLVDGLHVRATNALPCVLAPSPCGTLDFVVDNVTTNQRLMRLSGDFTYAEEDFSARVSDAAGNPPAESWTVLPQNGWLTLQLQDIDRPAYALTFEQALNTTEVGSKVVPLTSEGSPRYVRSRDGWAMTGGTPYSSAAMSSVPASWTVHAVAKMPKEKDGILFGYGRQGERGVGLVTVDADHVAVAWWDSRGRFTVITAEVPNATYQFHAYELVSTGVGVSLYVDGVRRGSAVAAVNPTSPLLQIGSTYGNRITGFERTATGVLDDWRLYDGVLSASAIKTLSDRFAPWPDCRTAVLPAQGASWNDLSWQGPDVADGLSLLENQGGVLSLTNDCSLASSLVVKGSPLAIRLSGDGALRTTAEMDFSPGFSIDASGLDGTNLAKCAVSGAPYVRWLVRGPYSGKPTVTALPPMPEHYAVHAEDFSAYGVRLVVTAPKGARLGSVSVSVGDDDFSGLSGELGIYPERASAWLPYRTWSTDFRPFADIGVAAIPMTRGQIDSATPYQAPAPLFFRHTSFDGDGNTFDGHDCGYVLSNLTAFAEQYRVIVYMASNQGTCWGPVTIGGRNYTGLLTGSDVSWASLSDSTLATWGLLSATPREGVNVVISDVLTNDVVSLVGHRQYAASTARGQIAAFQVVKVGEIPELMSVDYSALVTATTTWSDGAGDGLEPSVKWVNDAGSTITLTAGVETAALTFDTPVTAAVLSVVSAADRTFELAAPALTLGHEVESLDFELADGRVTVADTLGARYLFAGADTLVQNRGNLMLNVEEGKCLSLAAGLGWENDDTVAPGGHVRFLGTRTFSAPPIQTTGVIVSYERAQVTRASGNEFSVLRTLDGDAVVYDTVGKTLLNPLKVTGGVLTLTNSKSKDVLYYGSVRDVTDRHSSIEVSGGKLTVVTEGTGIDNTNCGLLVGTTDYTVHQPNIVVSGGEMEISSGRFTLWERSDLSVSGGTLSAQGLWKCGGKSSTVTLSGKGTLALGAGGIGRKSTAGSLSVTLAGGTLRATATMTIALAPTVSGSARVAAATGQSMTFAEKPTGTGTLLCDGEVVFAKGVDARLSLGGTFTLDLTAEQAASEREVVLFKAADSFDRTKVTLRGPNGAALPDGELRVADGQAIWMPASDSVSVVTEDVTVRVPRTWLTAQGVEAADLEGNHALVGANGLPVAVSYCLGLEPTNAADDVRCSLSIDGDGRLTFDLPNVRTLRQPDPAAVRYVLQHKTALADAWTDHSTNSETTVTVESDGSSARFFRYLILLK